MVSEASKALIGMTTLGLVVATGVLAEPPALTITTPSLRADPSGYLYCVTVAIGRKPIDMVTSLVTLDGEDVTEFRSSLRASPPATEDGRYHAEDRAGTMNDGEAYCEVVVQNVRRRDVHVMLTSHAEDGTVLDSVPQP